MIGFDLRSVARALGGELIDDQILAPGPGHSTRDRSLVIRFDPHAPDRILVHSFCGDDPLLAKDYVRERLGLPRQAKAKTLHIDPVSHPDSLSGDMVRTAQALAIWSEAHDPRGTPVEAYLRHRGIDLPLDVASEAIRFHPSCPFAGERTLAMVCLVRDMVTDAPKAIHRTALSLEGHKVKVGHHDRLSLGPVGGGAIKVTPDADVTTCLGIGEGLESTLSLRLTEEFGISPVWCLLSTSGMSNLPVLAGVECLWIAVDHDAAGLKASSHCSAKWRAAGREVALVKPRSEGSDLNNLIKKVRYA
jgi:hypothetical protein